MSWKSVLDLYVAHVNITTDGLHYLRNTNIIYIQ